MSKVSKSALRSEAGGAASATYRKAVNAVSEVLDQEPVHTAYPSQDFAVVLDGIPEAMKAKALEWYERGIKRGMARATDLMADGTIYLEDGTVYAPSKIEVKVRTKFQQDAEWESRKIVVDAQEIGFGKS